MGDLKRSTRIASLPRRSLGWLFAGGGRLKERVVRGGIWLLLGDGVTRVAGMLKLAVLGRLLSPHDFGLMGIAILMLRWLEQFTESGITKAMIRSPGDIRPYLDTAWTVQILRSLGLSLVLYLTAPYGAWFFRNPEVTPIIQALALLTLLRGFTNPAIVYMPKELDFRRFVTWKLMEVGAGLAVAIPLAFIYRNVWALTLSLLAGQAVQTVTSFWIKPYRPGLAFDWARARELLRFGRWIFGLNLVNFLSINIDSLTVGKMLGSTALGFYQVAHQVATLPTNKIRTVVARVMFPTFAKLREGERSRAFLQMVEVVASFALPVGCFLTIFAGPVVHVLLGERWLPITATVQVLAWYGVAKALMGVTVPLLQALGRPEVPLKVSVWRILLMAALLYPFVSAWGIMGAALAITISTTLTMVYQVVMASRLAGSKAREMVGAFKTATWGSVPFLGAGALGWFSSAPALPLVLGGLALGLYLTIMAASLKPYLRMLLRVQSS